jgi:hypothetical protein
METETEPRPAGSATTSVALRFVVSLPTGRCSILADQDHVIVRGRFSGMGQPVNWIAADFVRIAHGVLADVRRQVSQVRK